MWGNTCLLSYNRKQTVLITQCLGFFPLLLMASCLSSRSNATSWCHFSIKFWQCPNPIQHYPWSPSLLNERVAQLYPCLSSCLSIGNWNSMQNLPYSFFELRKMRRTNFLSQSVSWSDSSDHLLKQYTLVLRNLLLVLHYFRRLPLQWLFIEQPQESC